MQPCTWPCLARATTALGRRLRITCGSVCRQGRPALCRYDASSSARVTLKASRVRGAHRAASCFLTTSHAATCTNTEEIDDALEAYEALLTHAVLSGNDDEEMVSSTTSDELPSTEGLPASPEAAAASEASTSRTVLPTDDSADTLVASVLSVLPWDGQPMRLTDITPLVDTETICQRYGSMRRFVETYPRVFSCTSEVWHSPTGKPRERWLVQRQSALGRLLNVQNSVPNAATNRTDERPDGEAVAHLQKLMSAYLDEELAQLTSPATYQSHSTAAPHACTTAEATRPSSALLSSLLSDEAPAPAWHESIPFEDDDDTHETGGVMDDDHGEGELASPTRDDDGVSAVSVVYHPTHATTDARQAATATATGAKTGGTTKGKQQRRAASSASRSPATSAAQSSRTPPTTEAVVRTAAELEALHTTLAERRGWRTPRELLDYFVECVPTFFVPLTAVVATDALAKLLGPRSTMPRVLGIYHYYFDFQTTDTPEATVHTSTTAPRHPPRQVRLRSDLVHPGRGKADPFYRAYAAATNTAEGIHAPLSAATTTLSPSSDETSTTCGHSVDGRPSRLKASAVTSTFAALQPTIPSGLSGRAATPHRRAPRPPAPPSDVHGEEAVASVQLKPDSNLFYCAAGGDACARELATLCLVMPSTHYVPLTAVALQTGLAASRVRALVQDEPYSTHHGLFLTHRGGRVHTTVGRNCSPDAMTDEDGEWHVRLRPFTLSPSAVGDRDPEELPERLRRQLRPVWTPLSRFLTRLPDAVLSDLKVRARATPPEELPGIKERAVPRSQQPRIPFSTEAEYLMQFGGVCWLQQRARPDSPDSAATRGLYSIRQFTGDAALDDAGLHVVTMLLQHYAHPTQWQTLAQVLARAEADLVGLSLITDRTHTVGAGTVPPALLLLTTVQQTDPAKLVRFIAKQRLVLQSELRDRDGALPTPEVWLRRRTALASFQGS